MSGQGSITFGVLVPCRNEEAVIGRRLKNLLDAVWPDSDRRHELVVIDDGSKDDTARCAEELLSAGGASEHKATVVKSSRPPGKNGAISTGLEQLSERVDVVLLTDADVVMDPGALEALADAFAEEPMLGMASGVQSLHSSLPRDGSAPQSETAMGLYDSWTRWVRRIESKRGRLFSVHGQLLAWRRDLGLEPGALFADDLELMLQLRRLHPERTVRMVEGARFHEERSSARDLQDLRRAQAYLQAAPFMDAPELGLQGWLYRRLPPNAPELSIAGLALLAAAAWMWWGSAGLAGLFTLSLVLLIHPAPRRVMRLLWVIQRARRVPAPPGATLAWETPRA